jgi:ribosomal protein L29
MNVKELKNLAEQELKKLIEDKKQRLRELRFDLSSGKVKNVREIRQAKKMIAQSLTILKERNGK